MGWNQLAQNPARPCPLLNGMSAKPWMYFVHSYFPMPASADLVWATATHGIEFPAIVGRDNVFGTQFHPEKSQRDGIALLSAFGGFVKGSTCTSMS